MRRYPQTVKLTSPFLNLNFETTASNSAIWVVMLLWMALWFAVYTVVMLAIVAAVNAMGADVPYWAGVVLGWGVLLLAQAIKGD